MKNNLFNKESVEAKALRIFCVLRLPSFLFFKIDHLKRGICV